MISVVIPVFNVKPYLIQCLDSVIGQSYADLQIIIVDDGSTDGCGEICDEYSRLDDRIQVVHQSNQGLSVARNTGIDIAEGEYILFVDSDDYLFPHCVEMLYNLCLEYHAEIAVCSYRLLMEDGREASSNLVQPKGIEVYNGLEIQQAHLQQRKIGDIAWGKLYKKVLFDGVRYPVGKYYEDMLTTFKLLHVAKRVVSTDEVGCVYRQRKEGITKEPFSVKQLDRLQGSMEKLRYAQDYCPEYAPNQYVGLLAGCVALTEKMVSEHISDPVSEESIQRVYRKYFPFFFQYARSSKLKVFAVLGYIHIGCTKLACRISGVFK